MRETQDNTTSSIITYEYRYILVCRYFGLMFDYNNEVPVNIVYLFIRNKVNRRHITSAYYIKNNITHLHTQHIQVTLNISSCNEYNLHFCAKFTHTKIVQSY